MSLTAFEAVVPMGRPGLPDEIERLALCFVYNLAAR